jgi:two-component system sensor histidine kinase CreC
MNIAIRLFAGYFLLVGVAAWFVLNIFSQEVAPGIRQGTEETLVDSANMLAELAAPELAASKFNSAHSLINEGQFARAVRAAGQRSPAADIYGVNKSSVDFRVYVTDAKGIVRFDTEPGTLGADYSKWMDVARVLRGEYGARSSRSRPDDPTSSTMYVAAPIMDQNKLIGVLTVAKPSSSILPYADRAEARIRHAGILLVVVSSLIGVVFTLWLTWSITRLRNYARAVADGRKVAPPTHGGSQFAELARALADMRKRLDGKQYVESYVQNLAHEMKSPLTAITGAAELLQDELPPADQARFVQSIGDQSQRLREIIDRMLQLAHIEQLQAPSDAVEISLAALLQEALAERELALTKRQLQCACQPEKSLVVHGDRLLLKQAVLNLLDNAIDFSVPGGHIEITAELLGRHVVIKVRDHGAGAPDYAVGQLFDRFYSLPRPSTGEKSTGLGLSLVREVARLHGGDASFNNHAEGGAIASLSIAV